MKKIIYNVIAVAMLAMLMPAQAVAGDFWDSLQVKARVGYNIGGTAPVPLPRSIRSIESYKLTASFMVGADAEYGFNGYTDNLSTLEAQMPNTVSIKASDSW